MKSGPATGVMICGHGSRDREAAAEFNAFVAQLTKRLTKNLPAGSAYAVASGFLQAAHPEIGAGLKSLKDRGVQRIVCLPCMLFSAGHVKNDLPKLISGFSGANPGVEMILARELGIDAKLLNVAAERIKEAENALPTMVDRSRSLLLVLGHGGSDLDANSNMVKITRMLWEGLGFGWAETAFSSGSGPRLGEALAAASKLGCARIVCLPYFLFNGVLVKKAKAEIFKAQSLMPSIKVLMAGHLGGHPQIVECFALRLTEALSGDNAMNCLDCDARQQIHG